MSKNWLQFRDIRILSFAGISKGQKADIVYPEGFKPSEEIDPNNGIVIFFPPDARYIEASGDKGVGKSSFLSLVSEAAGAMGFPRFINTKDKDKKYDQTIQLGEDWYRIKATRTQFDLFKLVLNPDGTIQTDAKGEPVGVRQSKPKDLLKKLIGPVGKSPIDVAAMKPDEQVKWIRTVAALNEQQQAFEKELNGRIKETYDARTKANNETNRLHTALENNGYYKDYEGWIAKFKEAKFENMEAEVERVTKAHAEYTGKQQELADLTDTQNDLQSDITRIEEEIKRLQLQLNTKKEEWKSNDAKRDQLQNYLEDNKQIKDDFANISQKVAEAQQYHIDKANFEHMVRDLNSYNHFSGEATRLDGKLTELRELKKKFLQDVTPKVEGLELFIPDEEETREGLYYNGLPLNMVCESDNWLWHGELSRVLPIKIIHVENVTSLGTETVEKFNEFIQAGGMVFGTRMERGQRDLRITFHTKMPMRYNS
jgi:hypothetical protein